MSGEAGGPMRRRQVLLVEDEVAILLYAEMVLSDLGFDVAMAPDGARGLELVEARAPDLIVTDFMMPRMDGIAMLRRLREAGVKAPAIVVSAIPQSQLPVEPDEALFDAVLAKPMSEDRLVAVLERLLPADDAAAVRRRA